jgi:hypothetical protein
LHQPNELHCGARWSSSAAIPVQLTPEKNVAHFQSNLLD